MSKFMRDGYVFLVQVHNRYMFKTASLREGVESSDRTQVMLTLLVNDIGKAEYDILEVLTRNYERCLDYDGYVFAGDQRNMVVDIFTWWANSYSLRLPPTIPHIDNSIDIEALIEQKVSEKLQTMQPQTSQREPPDLIELSSDDAAGLSEITVPRVGCVGLIEFVDKVKAIVEYDDSQKLWLKIVVKYVGDGAFETKEVRLSRPGTNGKTVRRISLRELPAEYESIKPSSSTVRRWGTVMSEQTSDIYVMTIKNLEGRKQNGGGHYYVPDLKPFDE